MKTFQYKAKDKEGQLTEGVIETQHFAEASSLIQARGLELISLEELKSQLEETISYLFDAVDAQGEKVQGTIQGTDEDLVRHQLEKDFGYQVSRIYRKNDDSMGHDEVVFSETIQVHQDHSPSESKEKEGESIIFQNAPKIIHSKPVIPNEELDEVHQSIQMILSEKGAALSSGTRDRLLYLDGMIELAREMQNKVRWKALKKDIRKAQQLAEREIQKYEEEKWKAYEQKNPSPKISSYSDFPEKITKLINRDGRLMKTVNWLKTVDLPNEQFETDILSKQQYESVWSELQRFSGALLVFYFVFFFLAYYFKRSGVEDSLLIRIYDTSLFKQIVLGIFLAYAGLTVRQEWLQKRLKTDVALVIGFIVIATFFMW